jgi:hypothetical protein
MFPLRYARNPIADANMIIAGGRLPKPGAATPAGPNGLLNSMRNWLVPEDAAAANYSANRLGHVLHLTSSVASQMAIVDVAMGAILGLAVGRRRAQDGDEAEAQQQVGEGASTFRVPCPPLLWWASDSSPSHFYVCCLRSPRPFLRPCRGPCLC